MSDFNAMTPFQHLNSHANEDVTGLGVKHAAEFNANVDSSIKAYANANQTLEPQLLADNYDNTKQAYAQWLINQGYTKSQREQMMSEWVNTAYNPYERSWGDAFTDTFKQVGSGATNLFGSAASGLGFDGVADSLWQTADELNKDQSTSIQLQSAAAEQQYQNDVASGMNSAMAAAKMYADNPRLIGKLAAEQLPQLGLAAIPMVGGAALVGTNVLAGGGNVRKAVREAWENMPYEDALNHPLMQARLKQGMSFPQALEDVKNDYSDNALSILFGYAIGGAEAATPLAKLGKGINKSVTGTIAKEIGVNALQGGAEQVNQNLAVRSVDGKTNWNDDLGRSMVEEGIGGAAFSPIAGYDAYRNGKAEQSNGTQSEQSLNADEQEIQQAGGESDNGQVAEMMLPIAERPFDQLAQNPQQNANSAFDETDFNKVIESVAEDDRDIFKARLERDIANGNLANRTGNGKYDRFVRDYLALNQVPEVVRQAEQQTTQGEVAPEIPQPATVIQGVNGEIELGSQGKRPFEYQLVEADELTVNLKPNAYQDRDRTSVESQAQIMDYANNLNPSYLGASVDVTQGAPTVDEQYGVFAGNGRLSAIKQAYAKNPEKATAYRDYLAQNAGQFGLTAEQVAGMKQPILVRKMTSPIDVRKAVKEGNFNTGLDKGVLGNAKDNAQYITDDLLDLALINEDGSLNLSSSNDDFIQGLVANIPVEIRPKFFAERKMGNHSAYTLTVQGRELVENALLVKAYSDGSSYAENLITDLITDISDSNKRVKTALISVAGKVIQTKGTDYDIAPSIIQAYDLMTKGKKAGLDVSEAINQGDMLNPPSEFVKGLVERFYSPKSVAEVQQPLNEYLNKVINSNLNNTQQDNMFGDDFNPSREQLLRESGMRASLARNNANVDSDIEQARTIIEQSLGKEYADRIEFVRSSDFGDFTGEGVYLDGSIHLFVDNIHSNHLMNRAERMAWVAWHEFAHNGVDVKFGKQYEQVMAHARSNAFIRRLTKIKQAEYRNEGVILTENLATEESLVELYAAIKTGNWDEIVDRYGVHVSQEWKTGEKKTGLEKIIDVVARALRNIASRITGKDLRKASIDDVLGMLKQIDNAVNSLAENSENQTASGDTRYSLNERSDSAFARAVDEVANGNVSRGYIAIGTTPDVLKMLGLPDTKIRIQGKTIEKVMGKYLGIEQGKHSHLHNLTPDTLKRLPQNINNPVAVFNSSTRENGYVVLTELTETDSRTGKNKPIIAALHLKPAKGGVEIIDIASVYGRSQGQLKTAFDEELLYLNKEKAQRLNTERLQLSWDFTSDVELSARNVKTEADLSQYQAENSTRYSFAGRNARNANHSLLAQAEQDLASGKNPEQIRKKTGWFKGVDGKWRFEIDDSQAHIKHGDEFESHNNLRDFKLELIAQKKGFESYEALLEEKTNLRRKYDKVNFERLALERKPRYKGKAADERVLWNEYVALQNKLKELEPYELLKEKGLVLSDVLEHDTLFENYPDLANVSVDLNYLDDNSTGYFNREKNEIGIDMQLTLPEMKSTLLHEIQHYIQRQEDFAKGGNTDDDFTSSVRQQVMINTQKELDKFDDIRRKSQYLFDQSEESYLKLREYVAFDAVQKLRQMANSDSITRVKKHVFNNAHLVDLLLNDIHHKKLIVPQSVKERLAEASRQTYRLPRSTQKGFKQALQHFAFDTAMAIESAIRSESLTEFKNDTRTTKAIGSALSKAFHKAQKALLPVRNAEQKAERLQKLAQYHRLSSAYDIYRSLAGEVESRNVQTRMNMTAEERLARSPESTEDVNRDAQIVHYGDGVVANSLDEKENSARFSLKRQDLSQKAYNQAKAEGKTELTFQQWKQVRSPEFKRWFGDWENDSENASKVVNPKTGEPLIVYHGTPSKGFTVFDIERLNAGKNFGKGIYLTSSKSIAEKYATGENSDVMALYVSMKNPFELKGNLDDAITKSIAGTLRYYDTLLKQRGYNKKQNANKISIGNMTAMQSEQMKSEAQRKLLLDYGYDGIIVPKHNIIVSLNKSNIKSATDNNGEFSAENDDIRYSFRQSAMETANAKQVNQHPNVFERVKNGGFAQFKKEVEKARAFIDTKMHDRLRPVMDWIDGIEVQGLSAYEKSQFKDSIYAAEGIKADIIVQAELKYLNPIRDDIATIAKKYFNGDGETALKKAGFWISTRWAIEKNAQILKADYDAMIDAEQEYNDSVANGEPMDVQDRLERAFIKAENQYYNRKADVESRDFSDDRKYKVGTAGGWSTPLAKAIMAKMESQIPRAELEALAEKVYDLNAWKLDQDLESGRFTAEEVKRFKQDRHYVPLTGDPSMELDDVLRMPSNRNPNVAKDKGLQGRKLSEADDAISTIWESVAKTATYNGWQPMKAHFAKLYDQAYQEAISNGLSKKAAADEATSKTGISKQKMQGLTRTSDNVLIYKENGNYYELSLPEKAMEQIKKQNSDNTPALLRPVQAATGWLARGVTQFKPHFAIVNMVRDLWEKSEFVRTKEIFDKNGNPLPEEVKNQIGREIWKQAMGAIAGQNTDVWKAAKRYATKQGLRDNVPAERELKALLKNGGVSTHSTLLERKETDLISTINKRNSSLAKGIEKTIRAVEIYNGIFDIVSSIAANRALLKYGVDPKHASAVTLDLTNFRKQGDWMPFIKSFYMFAQPTAVGGANLIKMMGTKTGRKRLLQGALFYGTLSFILRSIADEDEDGNAFAKEGDKDRFIPISINGYNFKLPVGYGAPQLMWNMGYNITEAIMGDKTWGDAAASTMLHAFKAVAPVSPSEVPVSEYPGTKALMTLTPTIAQPIVQNIVNRNAFGSSLASSFVNDKSLKAEQGKMNTAPEWTEAALWLNDTFGMDFAPEHVKNFVQGYANMVPLMNEALTILVENPNKARLGKPESVPFINALIGPKNPYATQSQFYRFRDEANDTVLNFNSRKKRDTLPESWKTDPEIRWQRNWFAKAEEMEKAQRKVKSNLTKLHNEGKLSTEAYQHRLNNLAKDTEAKQRKLVGMWRFHNGLNTTAIRD